MRAAELFDVDVVAANDTWAVGDFQMQGGGSKAMVLHWDGSSWSKMAVPSPGLETYLYGVAARTSADAWAVGTYYDPKDGGSRTLTLHWDRVTWSRVASPSPIPPGATVPADALIDVAVLTTGEAWAVGDESGYPVGTKVTGTSPQLPLVLHRH
jgi:hypothetical protein